MVIISELGNIETTSAIKPKIFEEKKETSEQFRLVNISIRENLDYVFTKMLNLIDDFYLDNKKNKRFTPNIKIVSKLEDELEIIGKIIAYGVCRKKDYYLIEKYCSIANEFRTTK